MEQHREKMWRKPQPHKKAVEQRTKCDIDFEQFFCLEDITE